MRLFACMLCGFKVVAFVASTIQEGEFCCRNSSWLAQKPSQKLFLIKKIGQSITPFSTGRRESIAIPEQKQPLFVKQKSNLHESIEAEALHDRRWNDTAKGYRSRENPSTCSWRSLGECLDCLSAVKSESLRILTRTTCNREF